jgi:hypothetical protein
MYRVLSRITRATHKSAKKRKRARHYQVGVGSGYVAGRPRRPVPDSALRALDSAAENFAWVGVWVEANPDLQGLADWVPTPGQVVLDFAKVERARLQCLCGVAEHLVDVAAEAIARLPFCDEAAGWIARAMGALDYTSSAAAAARAAATEARRAADVAVDTLPAEDPVRVACSCRVSAVDKGAEDAIAAVAAARARFDSQVGAATTLAKTKVTLAASFEALKEGNLDKATAAAMEALAGARRVLEVIESPTSKHVVSLGDDQVASAVAMASEALAAIALANQERATRIITTLKGDEGFQDLMHSSQMLGEVSGFVTAADATLREEQKLRVKGDGGSKGRGSSPLPPSSSLRASAVWAPAARARVCQAKILKEVNRLSQMQAAAEECQQLRGNVLRRMQAAKKATALAEDALEAARRARRHDADPSACYSSARTHALSAATALQWVIEAAHRVHR